ARRTPRDRGRGRWPYPRAYTGAESESSLPGGAAGGDCAGGGSSAGGFAWPTCADVAGPGLAFVGPNRASALLPRAAMRHSSSNTRERVRTRIESASLNRVAGGTAMRKSFGVWLLAVVGIAGINT